MKKIANLKLLRCIPYSRKLSRVKTFPNFAVLPPSAKVLSANFCAWGLGERVGGVTLTRAQGRSSFTRVPRVPLKTQQSNGSVQVTKPSMPNPRRCSRCCSSLRALSRSTPRVGFVRMRVVASAIRESFIHEMLYILYRIRESFHPQKFPAIQCATRLGYETGPECIF